jgi:hypothetical protein
MKRIFSIEADQVYGADDSGCCSRMPTHQMPSGYLCILPTHTRPSLFAD